jgi:hypothetical protein
MQLYQDALGFASPQGERGVADTHDEGVTTRARLGQDLDLLAVHETELEEATFEGGYGARARADADDGRPHTRRESGKAHVARRKGHSGWGDDRIHGPKYE